MKANRKFKDGEEAVSAVIGVILMVAITVAIAATVYVYVSGMLPAGSSSVPSLTLVQPSAAENGFVNFTVDSASQDAKWSDLKVMINDTDFETPKAHTGSYSENESYYTGDGTPISANDKLISFSNPSPQNHCQSGNEFVIIHVPSNSRVLTKTIY